MPISTTLYTELRFTLSDYVQRADWARLFEACRTGDDETSRTIAVIMSGYDQQSVWKFLEYVANLPSEARQERKESVATSCYIIARMGQTNVNESLSVLRKFLLEGSVTPDPVIVALSNLWVLNPATTASTLFQKWILNSEHSQILQEVAVSSCEYLAKNDPKSVAKFLQNVSMLEDQKIAKTAAELIRKYPHASLRTKKSNTGKKKKDKKKKHKKKKHKKKKK